MSPLGYHLVFRLRDDRPLCTSAAARRRFARTLGRLTEEFPVLAWRAVDTHLHLLGALSDAEVHELTRRLRISMRQHLHREVPLLLAVSKPVLDPWHLAEAFTYVLRQDARHGVGNDPLQEASSVVDLLGMRLLSPSLPPRVREFLPRLTRAELLVHLGVRELEERTDLAHLADATAAAFALPDLVGHGADSVAARIAAAQAAAPAGATAVANALGISRQCAWSLLKREPPPRAVRAVRLQMALRLERPLEEPFARDLPVGRLPAPRSQPRRPDAVVNEPRPTATSVGVR